MPQSVATPEHDLLQRSVKELTRLAGFPVAFGGLTAADGTPLTAFSGAHARSLDGVLIEPTHGCGGLAAVDRKPVAATNYRESSTITHHYDREVTAEGIVSLIAVPVVVDGRVRAILYGGHRIATQFGETIVRDTLKVSKALAWELSVADEVSRRLALLETQWPEQQSPELWTGERLELRELFAELRELGRTIADPEIVRRLDDMGRRILPHGMTVSVPTSLSPRELDMLAQVALGKRNGQIATQLGLTEATVKSYISAAMRKLNASNRYEAVIAARRAGLIP
ncbi:MAG: LuxR C-terminal-related transcriptional regulator [Pseudolysinimonas sp.]